MNTITNKQFRNLFFRWSMVFLISVLGIMFLSDTLTSISVNDIKEIKLTTDYKIPLPMVVPRYLQIFGLTLFFVFICILEIFFYRKKKEINHGEEIQNEVELDDVLFIFLFAGVGAFLALFVSVMGIGMGGSILKGFYALFSIPLMLICLYSHDPDFFDFENNTKCAIFECESFDIIYSISLGFGYMMGILFSILVGFVFFLSFLITTYLSIYILGWMIIFGKYLFEKISNLVSYFQKMDLKEWAAGKDYK